MHKILNAGETIRVTYAVKSIFDMGVLFSENAFTSTKGSIF